MSYTKAKIVKCKKASIRMHPWITPNDRDIVATVDGPVCKGGSTEEGSTIRVDLNTFCYDRCGRKFYKVSTPEGWIFEGCLDFSD